MMESPQLREFTVSEISFEIKKFVETTFNRVRVKGEIFGAKRADSGHWYLSLKDENSVLSAVCWKGVANNFTFKPEDGLEVIATGKITTFAGKSSYQLVIESMEVAGTGALLKLLEERKQKFAAEGLFDQRHKKKIPFLPETIGVITSASGAVIRDIIHRVKDRFPSHILLWPTPVQGEGAAEKIAQAIKGFNNLPLRNSELKSKQKIELGFIEDNGSKTRSGELLSKNDNNLSFLSAKSLEHLSEGESDSDRTELRCQRERTQIVREHSSNGFCNQNSDKTQLYRPDVLIVARGGGSLEDLWAFNEEVVIRAVFESEIPIISAVGHETDTMLIDYVSDIRAPTPTGAAEFAVPVRSELLYQVNNLEARLKTSAIRYLEEKKNYVAGLARGIPNLSQILSESRQKLDDRVERLNISFKNLINNKRNMISQVRLSPYYISNIFDKKKENLNNLAIRLESVSIDSVLKRGFAWVTGKNKNTIYNIEQAKTNLFLNIRLSDGTIKTKVVMKKDELQGDLFDI